PRRADRRRPVRGTAQRARAIPHAQLGAPVARGRRVARLLAPEARVPRRVARPPRQGRAPRRRLGRRRLGLHVPRARRDARAARARAHAVLARASVPPLALAGSAPPLGGLRLPTRDRFCEPAIEIGAARLPCRAFLRSPLLLLSHSRPRAVRCCTPCLGDRRRGPPHKRRVIRQLLGHHALLAPARLIRKTLFHV